ncbi:helix-turn-helix transcriptional regulator [uncultured Apibacter sp.]|uniref:helix-turn-helix domain-containing protein n=1 Tax=uncultured Apibacter sp. TaxID=1778616 RepID=UPI0025DCD260|nr:helix-turn-helix transcriptional regulator [uncultured Apibacter sp.]
MTIDNTTSRKIHQGRNIKRFREILGIKQEALAYDMGVSQSSISDYESKEILDDKVLEKIAGFLKVPTEAIKNFDEEQAVNIIANTYSFQDFKDNAVASGFNYQPSFNPVDKMVELYERMLQQQKEMIDKLEKLIEKK